MKINLLKIAVLFQLISKALKLVSGLASIPALRPTQNGEPTIMPARNSFDIEIPFDTMSKTATLLTTAEINEWMKNETKRSVEKVRILNEYDNYIKFINRNLALFNVSNDKKKEFSTTLENDFGLLSESIRMIIVTCRNNSNDTDMEFFMGTGISIPDNYFITASHNIDCPINYSLFKIVSDGWILDVINYGVPDIDDVAFLRWSKHYPGANFPLKLNEYFVPFGKGISDVNGDYHKTVGTPIVCFGFVGGVSSMPSRDGQEITKTQLYHIYGDGSIVASFGIIDSFNTTLKTTCEYAMQKHKNIDYEKCMKIYMDDNKDTFEKTSKFHILHTSNIINGMSGGPCIDAFDPSILIAINSHGKDFHFNESHANGTFEQHQYSIVNAASLMYYSKTYLKFKLNRKKEL